MTQPWRFRCPEGHTSWTRKQPPQRKRRGYCGPVVEIDGSGRPWRGKYRCAVCNEYYDKLLDMKTGELVERTDRSVGATA